MSDDFTILNPGAAGDVMDESGITYGTSPNTRKRPRVVLGGENEGDIAPSLNTYPTGSEFGVVFRPIISNYPGTSITSFNSATLVPQGVETTISTYTVPVDTIFYFIGLTASGNTNALFKFYVNGQPALAGRTSIANLNFDLNYSFSPLNVPAGQTVLLSVTHQTTAACDFEGTILGYIL